MALLRLFKYSICPGETNCTIFEANPRTACSGCELNLGWRPQDDDTYLTAFQEWIDYLYRVFESRTIAQIPESSLNYDEVTGLLLIRSEMIEVQNIIDELRRKQENNGQKSSD